MNIRNAGEELRTDYGILKVSKHLGGNTERNVYLTEDGKYVIIYNDRCYLS